MPFDPVMLSRIQFAWVIAWRILMPAFTVGAAAFIAVVEGMSRAEQLQVENTAQAHETQLQPVVAELQALSVRTETT
jgi:hypothetical protein